MQVQPPLYEAASCCYRRLTTRLLAVQGRQHAAAAGDAYHRHRLEQALALSISTCSTVQGRRR